MSAARRAAERAASSARSASRTAPMDVAVRRVFLAPGRKDRAGRLHAFQVGAGALEEEHEAAARCEARPTAKREGGRLRFADERVLDPHSRRVQSRVDAFRGLHRADDDQLASVDQIDQPPAQLGDVRAMPPRPRTGPAGARVHDPRLPGSGSVPSGRFTGHPVPRTRWQAALAARSSSRPSSRSA